MPDLVGVKFPKTGKFAFFLRNDLSFTPGDICIVETERGLEMGTVLIPSREVDQSPENVKSVVRHASEEDMRIKEELAMLEEEALAYCRQRISHRNMDMKLVSVDFTLDRSKAIFYFTADGRIDFRELVKDLAHQFHLRIEMRQIGVRDEAKMLGGIGICGQELCCARFLNRFDPVSIKMAKAQNLVLNPSKISGSCGRLMCCINYECNMENNTNRNCRAEKLQDCDGRSDKNTP